MSKVMYKVLRKSSYGKEYQVFDSLADAMLYIDEVDFRVILQKIDDEEIVGEWEKNLFYFK